MSNEELPNVALTAVLQPTSKTPETPEVHGYEWNSGIDYEKLLDSYLTTGFQATNVGLAIEEIQKMLLCRKQPLEQVDNLNEDIFTRRKNNCTIFLGFTSNLISSGLRETIRFLVQHKMVDCVVTSAGGIEEDIIKVLAPTYLGNFRMDGKTLRQHGINRIGNLLVPNSNYCKFEDWLLPILDKLLEETSLWTPSQLIARLGLEINNEKSFLYWAAKNGIPVFSPALTDGSLGDMLYFHSFKKPGMVLDILGDLKKLNGMAVRAANTGMIILGGGLIKHHICNANLMRNGADFTVFINTGNEFDGSDSGASPDEAVSWGKIRGSAEPVKVFADATLVFPLIVAKTFAREIFKSN